MSQSLIGTWQEYFSFYYINDITASEKQIFVASEFAIFTIDKTDKNIEKLSKINGLSDVGITQIEFYAPKNTLAVVYQNGNIDLIQDNKIYNLPDIKNKTTLTNKLVNNLVFKDDNLFLSMNFGIVKIDLIKKEITDTYIIGQEANYIAVYELIYDDKYFYAATSDGIYQAEINSPYLIDYRYWTLLNMNPYYEGEVRDIIKIDDSFFILYYDIAKNTIALMKYLNNSWQIIRNDLPATTYMFLNNNNIVLKANNVIFYNKDGQKTREIVNIFNENYYTATSSYVDADGKVMIGTNDAGFIMEETKDNFKQYIPNCPDRTFGEIHVEQDRLIVVGGAKSIRNANTWTIAQYSILQDDKWTTYKKHKISDFLSIEVDADDKNHLFLGGWHYGIFEYQDNTIINTFTEQNSVISSYLGYDELVRNTGLKYDTDKNLWMLFNSPNPLVVMKNDRTWESFNFDNSIVNKHTLGPLINILNYKCFAVETQSVMFFDDNNTISDPADDRYNQVFLIDDEGNSIGTSFHAIAIDKDENIWVGTNDGIAVLHDTKNCFDTDYRASRAKITGIVNDSLFTNYLLQGQLVTSIAVDGANRKWFGTLYAGVFLMSEDASVEILHFDMKNSPLPSNSILNITCDPWTGKVYFGTDKGVVSYQSDAIEGKEDFEDIYVYPNPVYKEHEGEIIIKGTQEKTNVKITDIAGNIVFETTSLGGQAIWDGKNFAGQKVATGVYLIFCTNEDASQTKITKLLFFN